MDFKEGHCNAYKSCALASRSKRGFPVRCSSSLTVSLSVKSVPNEVFQLCSVKLKIFSFPNDQHHFLLMVLPWAKKRHAGNSPPPSPQHGKIIATRKDDKQIETGGLHVEKAKGHVCRAVFLRFSSYSSFCFHRVWLCLIHPWTQGAPKQEQPQLLSTPLQHLGRRRGDRERKEEHKEE